MRKVVLLLCILYGALFANQAKEVNAALGIDKPPFIFGKTTKKGIEPDLLREAFSLVGYKVNIIQKPKDYLTSVLYDTNNIDLVATITPPDDKLFASEPFTSYENYVITRTEDHLKINSIEDLATLRFVAWKNAYMDLGDEFYKFFNPINGKAKQFYNDNLSQKDDIQMFFSRKVDAIVIDKTIFNWYKIHFRNNEQYTFHNIFKKTKTYPVLFRDKTLRDIFNKGLNKLKQNGRYDEIIQFYETQNVEELLTFTTLVSNISSKYLYKHKTKRLHKILKYFFLHPDIVAICIKSNDNKKNVLKLTRKYNKIVVDNSFDCSLLPRLTNDIYYEENGEIFSIGKLYIHYKKDYKTTNGRLIPPLKSLKKLSIDDFAYVKKNYTKLKLNSKHKIVLTKKEKEYIKIHNTITVHNEDAWAPYNFNENGIPKGFVIDYMDLLAKKLHINIKYISNYSWSEFLNLIKTEQIDVISNISKTDKRDKYLNFTKPFLTSKKAIFSNIPNIKKLSDLDGKTVAVPYDFFIHHYLKKHYPNIKIKTYKNTKECLYGVINKEADALIENYAVVNYLIKKYGLVIKYITINEDNELLTHLSIGVRKSQPILRDILQKAQDSITKDEFEKLENKWFGLETNKGDLFTFTQKQYLKHKKILKICTNPDWAPIEFINGNKPKGITIDILNLVLKKINLEPKYIQTVSWKQSQQFLKDKKCDILPSAIRTKQREEYANFTKPYLSYDLAIITQNNKPLVDNLSHIVDKTMARQEGSGLSMLLKQEYPNIKIINTKNIHDALVYVQQNKAYFTMATLPVLSYNKKREELDNLQVAGYSTIKYNLSIAVRDDDKELLNILDKVLTVLPTDAIKVIKDKWSTQEVIKKTNYTLVWIIIAVFSFILVIIFIAYQKQRNLKQKIIQLNNSLENQVKEEVEKNKQQQLLMLQQSRLAQMGEMISMIAHQWRQPLNSLSMLNQSIILKYTRGNLDDKAIQYFKENSKKQIQNMSKTIDDFRDFFKPEKQQVEFCINDIIADTLSMVKPIFTRYNIKVDLTLVQPFYTIGYPNELGQAILNIVNNAKDALIEKEQQEKKIMISLYEEEEKIILTIEDNAGGIPPKIIDKIFDPYFSTKDDKNGTGLGLYMSRIIIEDHMKAKLLVSNSENGAIFKIIFKTKDS